MARVFVIFIALANLIGCSAIANRFGAEPVTDEERFQGPAFYKGTYVDIMVPIHSCQANNEASIGVILLLDLPFSFVADTILIPYDAYQYFSYEDKGVE